MSLSIHNLKRDSPEEVVHKMVQRARKKRESNTGNSATEGLIRRLEMQAASEPKCPGVYRSITITQMLAATDDLLSIER